MLQKADELLNEHWQARDARLNNRPQPLGIDIEIVQERHHAINWVIGYCGLPWDEVTTDTWHLKKRTMNALRILTMVALLAISITSRADDAATAELDGLIGKYLEIIRFVPLLKQRLSQADGISNREALLAASDKDIIHTATPVLRPYIKLEEARQLVRFFTSETANAITRQQVAGNQNWLESLTPEQKAEFEEFRRSPGGDASLRMAIAWRSPGFWEKVAKALESLPESARQ